MKILWENPEWPGSTIEPGITDLAWIANAGDAQHGMLGVGSESGTVGITTTDLYPTEDDNSRYNFNLRGHHSAICMVTWNAVQNKLASCDASGMIYVWVRNEDRWSVELVNDRGVKVRDLCWSPCGSSALICYEDNFVLIGSASGQRVWSNSFNSATVVTCGVWAPDSHHLVVGFTSGNIQVLSDQGANITERAFTNEKLSHLAFSPEHEDKWTLAMQTETNKILMINSYDQIEPFVYESQATVIKMRWNSDGSVLALINSNRELVMLDKEARCIHREVMQQLPNDKELIALTWAFGGTAVIVAAGGSLAVGKIIPGVPSLFNLVCYDLWRFMGCSSRNVDKLPLPIKERSNIRALDHHIIRCRIPRIDDLCNYVCSVSEARCYCTIRPLARGSHSYVLCMEHLGGLVPLLIGRQVNRFLPQFHISVHPASSSMIQQPLTGSSAQVEDVSIIPRASTGRNSLWRRSKRHIRALMSRHVRPTRSDTRLLQVTSNIWCTRFNITSMNTNQLPLFLGQVVYKTSVLHLQPRQMTIDLALLTNPTQKEPDSSRRPSVCPSPSSCDDTYDDVTQLLRPKDDGLTKEERAFFDKVVSECTSLRAAMTGAAADSVSPGIATSQVSALKESPARVESRQGESDLSMSTTSTWQDEIESLEFIDGDDRDFLMPSTSRDCTADATENSSGCRPPPSTGTRTDIQTDLDRLVRIAGQLSHRYDFNKKDRASITKMRSQMKELLKRVNEIEKKVGTDDVRAEVRQLMRTLKEIKNALGEGRPPVPTYNRMLTMHNKTPFWNETNQVYQLDFGGRVTQESAKNFQVELDNKQVLQFGRIDGGAYTLDFRSPFSASQAFAVALASITQRLK